ncbi:hypothetical protein TNCV_101411 [Trichonephila clavipes]|nr:hypothetical protein TNCV_101411 [Trichonephila clavipes]
MVTPTLMSNEAAIYRILPEVAVHWRRIVSTLTKGSPSRVTSLDCRLTSRNTLHTCNTDYHNTPNATSLTLSFLICIFHSRFTSRVGWKRIAISSGPKEP